MNFSLVLQTATLMASWMLLVRYAATSGGVEAAWTNALVCVGTCVVAFFPAMLGSERLPTAKLWPLALILVCGLMNGLGLVSLNKIAIAQGSGLALAAMFSLMIAMTTVGSGVLYKDPLTLSKMAGVGAVIFGIWLMKR